MINNLPLEIKRLIILYFNNISWLSIDQRLYFKINIRNKIIIPNVLQNWKIIKPFTTFVLGKINNFVTDIRLGKKNFSYIIRYEIKNKKFYVLMQSRSGTKKLNKIIKYLIPI